MKLSRWRTVAILAVSIGFLGASTLPAQEDDASGPRRLLEMHGIDASQLNRFHDGQPLGGADDETLIRILDRMPRFPKEKLSAWVPKSNPSWSDLRSSPDQFRAQIFGLRGRVTRVERAELLPEVAARLDFQSYYRVTLALDADEQALICTRNLPTAWQTGVAIHEPGGARGLFLEIGETVEGRQQFVFAADRIEWFPEQANAALGVTPSHVYLARQGFDVGLLDQARAANHKPLSLVDRECFYAMLAAVRRTKPDEFASRSDVPIDIIEVLKDPQRHQGNLMSLRGIARRATRVRVDDPDVQQRFGIRDYFQIDLFVDLDQQVIKFGKLKDGESPIFENAYPVTVCTPTLPAGLQEGELLRENIEVDAALFKLWTYSSEYVKSFDERMQQVSPMLIGVEPRVVEVTDFNPGFGMGLAILVVVSLVAIWIGLRRHGGRTLRPSNPDDRPPDFSGVK